MRRGCAFSFENAISMGFKIRALIGTALRLERPSRTALSKASTASYGMNTSMKRCSAHYVMRAKRWKNGKRITIGTGHIQRWET